MAQPTRGQIQLLPPHVAQKIAAGEVIDRPLSVVRELLDNAIDAGADSVDIRLEGGGTRLIRVADNGSGMGAEQLHLSILPHSTSKLRAIDDLLTLNTLGFRGEALASIVSVSDTWLYSKTLDQPGHAIHVVDGSVVEERGWEGPVGTIVEVRDLFFSFPPRKRFLKQDSTEYTMCKSMVMERALWYPQIGFFLSHGTKRDLELMAHQSNDSVESLRLDRLAQLYPKVFSSQKAIVSTGNESGFAFQLYTMPPMNLRRDKRYLQVFVNGRRVWEYSLLKAIEAGYGSYLPGGYSPVVFGFFAIDPGTVDFNIHPAKKEIKLLEPQALFRSIRSSMKSALDRWRGPQKPNQEVELPGFTPPPLSNGRLTHSSLYNYKHHPSDENISETNDSYNSPTFQNRKTGLYHHHAEPSLNLKSSLGPGQREQVFESSYRGPQGSVEEFRYIGQLFGVFLLVERFDEFWLLDMHAAHERILYNRLKNGTSRTQKLLIPHSIDLSNQGPSGKHLITILNTMGFDSSLEGQVLVVRGIPEKFPRALESLERTVADEFGEPERIVDELFAQMACKSAIKEGELLTDSNAESLIKEALALPEPRCPHGRPIWARFTRRQLYDMVRR